MIIGVGVDIVEIPRLRKIIAGYGDRFTQRVFTPEEREYSVAHADPAPNFAVRFAAKEALFKALGTGWANGVTWLDVEVRRKAPGAPFLELTGEAAKLSKTLGTQSIHLSLSHSENSAIAFVILES